MAINSGVPIDEIVMTASTDTTVLSCSDRETKGVYRLTFHAQDGVGGNVEVFLSDSAVSAASDRIRYVQLAGNEDESISVAVGKNKYLIAKADAGNIIFDGEYTHRTGGDAK